MQNYISVIGGINIDIKGIADNDSAQADSHEGKVHFASGGVSRNISENLARLNVPVYLFGCVGNDFYGNFILERTSSSGVSIQHILKSDSASTAKYLSVSKSGGDLVYAVNDMKDSLGEITAEYIQKNSSVLSQSKLIILDTNLSKYVLKDVISLANENGIPVFIDTVSAKKAEVINELKGTVDFLSPNYLEFETIFGKGTGKIFDEHHPNKFKYIILKKGASGVSLYDFTNKHLIDFKAIELNAIEPNGAGDSFNAGFIFGLINNYPVEECVKLGICAAYFTLQCVESVSEKLTPANLLEVYSKNFK